MKTEAQIVSAFETAGGYTGTGKHRGVVRGDTEAKAILNARDSGKLISMQQEQICYKRFPSVDGNLDLVPNTPGGTDSLW